MILEGAARVSRKTGRRARGDALSEEPKEEHELGVMSLA